MTYNPMQMFERLLNMIIAKNNPLKRKYSHIPYNFNNYFLLK